MRVQVSHSLGRDRARHRLAGFADALAARPWPAGVSVRDLVRNWTGDRLDFAFVAARGFFSLPIRGWLDVADSEVVLDADMPAMLMSFVGEGRIRAVLEEELSSVLAEPGDAPQQV
jgi:hypothetical protein